MSPQMCIALSIGVVATVEDIARRRISNWIPAVSFLAGLAGMTVERGWRGGLSSLGGAVAGFAVFLVLYWLGGMGGGDVKLMAGFGAVVGIERLLPAALWTSLFGGLLAVAVVLASAIRRRISLCDRVQPGGSAGAIPYAPAIALGAVFALVA